MPSMLRPLTGVVCVIGSLAAAAAAADDPPAAPLRYKLTIKSDLRLAPGGKAQADDAQHAEASFGYEVRREKTDLYVSLLHIESDAGGPKARTHRLLSKARFFTQVGDAVEEDVDQKAMSAAQRKLADGLFEAPLWKLETDPDGRVTRREFLPEDPVVARLAKGMLSNVRLFHPPFPAAADRWEADNEVLVETDKVARGKLAYAKRKPVAGDGRVTVRASGALEYRGDAGADAFTTMTVRYAVGGEQTYDPKLRDWVSGDLTIKVTMAFGVKGKPDLTSTGDMRVTLEMLPGK